MKKIVLLTILIMFALFQSIHVLGENQTKESGAICNVLDSIQNKIEYAMYESFAEVNTVSLDKIYTQLNEIKPKNNIIPYWMAYVNYYQAVFFLKMKDKENSQKKLGDGIKQLENQRKKNSEDYALLALLQSFSVQFKSGMAAGIVSSKVVDNAEKAIDIDSLNLRAWYVLASNDFYTPESFGGGKKVESYLKKAISLPDKSYPNSYLPSWGKEYAYDLLIRLYIKQNKMNDAREIFKSASQLFPNSYTIKQYEKKLKTN